MLLSSFPARILESGEASSCRPEETIGCRRSSILSASTLVLAYHTLQPSSSSQQRRFSAARRFLLDLWRRVGGHPSAARPASKGMVQERRRSVLTRSIRCSTLERLDLWLPRGVSHWRRHAFRESGARHHLSAPLSSAEQFTVGAFRFWKWCRRASQRPLPSLHQRLAPAGGAMLAVPLNDFFTLIASRCTCTRDTADFKEKVLMSDEVIALTLLHAAGDARPFRPETVARWTPRSLLLVAAWAVRHQLASELGLGFGADSMSRPVHHAGPSAVTQSRLRLGDPDDHLH